MTVHLLSASKEDVGFPVSVTGVARATLETFTAEVAVLAWSSTEPPPEPDGSTSWLAASWDTEADQATIVATFGPGGVVTLTDGVTYRAYVRITGGDQAIVADGGTIVAGLASTYSGDPSTSDRDAARFMLGDVTAPFQLTNAEVDYALSSTTSVAAAAADLAEALAARYSSEAESESVGDISITRKRAKAYRDLAGMLAGKVVPGGTSPAPLRFRAGTGYEAPAAFWIGQHDHPEAPAGARPGAES